MPTFDFTCLACEAAFEFARPFGSKQKPRCPACGSTKTEKQIMPPTIHFKGAGFFVTDSRKTDAKKPLPAKQETKESTTPIHEKKNENAESKNAVKKTKSE